MKFRISKEFLKMLELMDKSNTVKRFIWFLVFCLMFALVLFKLPTIGEFINLLRNG